MSPGVAGESDLLPHLFVCPSSITPEYSTPREKAHGKNSSASSSSTRPLPVSVVVGDASLSQPPLPDADSSPWFAGAGFCLFDDAGWRGWFRVGKGGPLDALPLVLMVVAIVVVVLVAILVLLRLVLRLVSAAAETGYNLLILLVIHTSPAPACFVAFRA
jgi:hypothetical protein